MYKRMFVSSYKRKQHDKHFMRQGYHIKTRISAGDNKDLRAGIASQVSRKKRIKHRRTMASILLHCNGIQGSRFDRVYVPQLGK